MARFTLSIADDIAAQLDAYAAENNLNRSQAAEHIFRSTFQTAPSEEGGSVVEQSESPEEVEPQPAGNLAYLNDHLLEIQEYLTLVYSRQESLREFVEATTDLEGSSVYPPRMLPEPPWVRRARGY